MGCGVFKVSMDWLRAWYACLDYGVKGAWAEYGLGQRVSLAAQAVVCGVLKVNMDR